MSLQEKRQTQLARKPVGAHSDSDTDFSHVTCCSGIIQLRLSWNDKLPPVGRGLKGEERQGAVLRGAGPLL